MASGNSSSASGCVAAVSGLVVVVGGIIAYCVYNDGVMAHVSRGDQLTSEGKPEQAIEEYNEALKYFHPKQGETFRKRGWAYFKAGDNEQALADLNRSLEIDREEGGTRSTALNEKGVVLAELGRHEEAITQFDESARLKPDPVVLTNRGTSRFACRRYDEAKSDYLAALELDSNCEYAHAEMCRLHCRLGQYELARKDVAAMRKANPTSSKAGRWDAAIGAEIGRDRTLADLGAEIDRDPTAINAHVQRAGLLAARSRCEDAIAGYTTAVTLAPTRDDLFNARGECYRAVGQAEQARADFDRAIQLNPRNTAALSNRARTLESLGRGFEAVEDLAAAGRYDPTYAPSYQQLVQRLQRSPPRIKVLSVDLEERWVEKPQLPFPPIKLTPGHNQTFRNTVKLRHEVMITDAWASETGVRGKLTVGWAEVESGLRNTISRSTGRVYGVEFEDTREVEIRGDAPGVYAQVRRVDLYRVGRAQLLVDGARVTLPFEFREDFLFRTETVNAPLEPVK